MSAEDSAVIRLGNPSVHEAKTEEGQVVDHTPRPDLGEVATTIHLPSAEASVLRDNAEKVASAIDDRGRSELLVRVLTASTLEDWEIALKHVAIVVSQHARAGVAWVAAEDKKLEALLAKFFEADGGEPSGFSEGVAKRLSAKQDLPPVAGGSPELDDIAKLARHDRRDWPAITRRIEESGDPTALKTKGGVELIANASFGTATQPAALNYFALTENNEAEKNTNTTLAGEYTTASGGLLRKQATYAYTEGTASATLTVTWTANGSDALPFTAHKFGVFNKVTSGGTMGIETKITATTWNASGDNATLTETLAVT